ncbi:MAG TPA: hypothetical protein GXZ27_08640 [Thermoanaerobacterales bacterium]|nr:hypothetical protein [Thermoanaerobacterales bacterium]
MAIPQKVNFTEIASCKYLKYEETCYGPIQYCSLQAWGKHAACKNDIKQTCENEHYIIM